MLVVKMRMVRDMAEGEGANRVNAKDCVVICRNLKSILETMGNIGVSVRD